MIYSLIGRQLRRHKPKAFIAALCICAVIVGAATFPAMAQQASDVRVTNHLFAERVIQTAEGGYIAQDVIVGFERGTHTFDTLTQIVLPKGNHQIEMALVDPKGVQLDRLKFGTLQANEDGWTQSLRGSWRNVRFESAGIHELIVYRAGKVVARFFLTVT